MAKIAGTGGAGGNIFDAKAAKNPPGNALLKKEAKAQKKLGTGPSFTPGDVADAVGRFVKQTINPPANTVTIGGKTHRVAGSPVFNPATLIADTLLHAPGQVGNLHQTAKRIGAGDKTLTEKDILGFAIQGGLGFPHAGVKEPGKPHPLIAAKPTIQKGAPPTVKTLGEAVTGGLKGARTARAEQENLRSPERASRAQAFGKVLQENPTAAGARQASSHLKGKYPVVDFAGFKEFSPEAHDVMVKAVADHPDLRPFEQKRATKALEKVRLGVTPQRNEEKLLLRVFGPNTTKQLMSSASVWRKIRQHGLDIANLPRSVQSSIDVSGAGRQSLLMATGHPVLWAKNLGPMFKAFASEDYYVAKMDDLHRDPFVADGTAAEMGLELTELSPKAGTGLREEAFPSPLAEKIPGVRMSSRAYTYLLDKNRVDLAKKLYATAVKDEGKQVKRLRMVDDNHLPRIVREPIDSRDPELLDSIGRFSNSATGRGDLGHGKIGNSADLVNLIFYSPRLIKSRVDFLNPFWYAKLHPIARHEAYRSIAGLVGLVVFADAVASEAGAGVNLDPRSSDFAKIKFGNTRIDLAGGFLQYLRVLSELATQQTVTQKGDTVPLAPFRTKAGIGKTSDGALLLHFLRNKFAPVASAVADIGFGQNAIGQPTTPKNLLLPRFTPLAIQDAISVGKDASSTPAGIAAGVGAYGLAAFGVGVQNYTPKQPKAKKGFGGNVFDNAPASQSPKNIFDK